jgi:AraC family transcriptional regulator, transcriptional activator of pobA
MEFSVRLLHFSDLGDNSEMAAGSLLLVPFSEVRHDLPDDCLHYESVAIRGAEMDWKIPAHRHDGLHQLQLLERGHVRGTIDGSSFDAEAPLMLMLAPNSVHGFSYAKDSVGHQLTIPTATLRRLLGDLEFGQAALGSSFVISAPGHGAAEIASLFQQLSREFVGSSTGRVAALLGLASLIAVQFIRRRGAPLEGVTPAGLRDTLVQRYLALVEEHHAEHRALDFYASRLGVGVDHLSRTCRKVAGRSALQLAHERLMLEARRLLAYSALPVTRISARLGYADPGYFSKVFARAMGHTPTAYRALIARGVRSAPEASETAGRRGPRAHA